MSEMVDLPQGPCYADLKGKVALVTGGGKGIGKGIAIRLAQEAMQVYICGRTEATLHETGELIRDAGGLVEWVVADISDARSVAAMLQRIETEAGRLDVLVHNAALLGGGPLRGMDFTTWRERFAGRPPGVLHSFSGPVDYAEQALEMGLFIAFGGLVFRRGEEASAEVAKLVPLDRLLTETDSPYLKPRGVKGSRNQPLNVAVTANWLFDLRDDEPDAFGQALVDNFDRFTGADR